MTKAGSAYQSSGAHPYRQVGAGITNVRRRELRMLSANAPLVILAIAVAVIGFMLWV